jgi:hypothetical protein
LISWSFPYGSSRDRKSIEGSSKNLGLHQCQKYGDCGNNLFFNSFIVAQFPLLKAVFALSDHMQGYEAIFGPIP